MMSDKVGIFLHPRVKGRQQIFLIEKVSVIIFN